MRNPVSAWTAAALVLALYMSPLRNRALSRRLAAGAVRHPDCSNRA